MNAKFFIVTAGIILTFFTAPAQNSGDKKTDKSTLKTGSDSLSYALGITVGQSLTDNNISVVDYAVFMKAFKGFRENPEKMEMSSEAAFEYINSVLMRRAEQEAAVSRKKSEAFLEENKRKEGVITTDSGLQYKIINKGSGTVPGEDDTVTVHYKGTLIDGTVFDSSMDRGEPVTFVLNQVIPGWIEGLTMMPAGSKFMLYIPNELAYGDSPSGGIPAFSTLIFEVELLEVKKSEE